MVPWHEKQRQIERTIWHHHHSWTDHACLRCSFSSVHAGHFSPLVLFEKVRFVYFDFFLSSFVCCNCYALHVRAICRRVAEITASPSSTLCSKFRRNMFTVISHWMRFFTCLPPLFPWLHEPTTTLQSRTCEPFGVSCLAMRAALFGVRMVSNSNCSTIEQVVTVFARALGWDFRI